MKRSSQVALLLMGAAGVGASAYALAPGKRDCLAPGAPPPAASTTAASPVAGKDPKLEPCPPRRSYTSNTGYYRSHWYSSSAGYWWGPIFNRNPASTTTSTTSTNSPTSLGFTSKPGSTTTTARPSTTTTTTRTGFGTIGRSVSVSS